MSLVARRRNRLKFSSLVQAMRFIHMKDLFRWCKPCWMSREEWFQSPEGKKQLDGPTDKA